MARRKSGLVRFIATYEDGSTHSLEIDTFTLRGSDAIAIIIAGEMQQGGQLPPGKIKSVKRAPFYEQPDYKAPGSR